MKNIVFVCTGNTCRSPMAEGIFNSMAKERELEYRASSCGISAVYGSAPSKNAVSAAAENGIDISKHKSARLTADAANDASLILTMTPSHKETLKQAFPSVVDKIYTLPEYIKNSTFTDVFDPFGGDMQVYRTCFSVLEIFIKELIEILEKQ